METLLNIEREGIKRVAFLKDGIVALGECLYINEDEICPEELIDMDVNDEMGLIALLGHDNVYIYDYNKNLIASFSLDLDLMLLNANRVGLGPGEIIVCGEDDDGPLVLVLNFKNGDIRAEMRTNCVDVTIRGYKAYMVNLDVPEDFSLDYVAKLDVLDLTKKSLRTVYQRSSEDLWDARVKVDWDQTLLGFDGVVRVEDEAEFPGRFGLPLPNNALVTFSMDYLLLFDQNGKLVAEEKVGWINDADWRSNMLLLGGPEGIKVMELKVERLGLRTAEHISREKDSEWA